MRILMISSYLPYPLFSGGHIRLYNLIRQLSEKHEVTLICEKRNFQTEEDVLAVKKFCKDVITVDRKKQWSLENILKAGFSLYSFLMVGHSNQSMKQKIKEALFKPFDLIHVETSYVFQNLPETTLPIVLVEHNVEYLVYRRFAEKAPLILRPLYFLDERKMRFWEEKFWQRATKLVMVSEKEKELTGRKDAVVVPNGVDVEKFEIRNSKFEIFKEKRILFIGDFRWIQNRDAVEWIITAIWPGIIGNWKLSRRSGIPYLAGEIGNLRLWIVGKKIPDSIKRLTDDLNVIFDENAPDDTAEIFKKADLLLAPIRVGGGTSFKILEALASGVPVITTSLGIEGIGAGDREEALVSDSAQGLADNVVELLQDEKLYNKLSINARRLVEEKFDWKIIIKKLERVYDEVTRNSREY